MPNSPPLKKLQLHKICTNPPPPPQHPFLSSFFFFLSFLLHFSKKKKFRGGATWSTHPLSKKFTIFPPPPNIHFHLHFLSIFFPSFFKIIIILFFFWGGGGLNHLANSYVYICPPPHMFLSFFTLTQNGITPCRWQELNLAPLDLIS